MLRGFRHTLFLLLQIGVLLSGVTAAILWPDAWRAILLCVVGSLLASWICERIARDYLRRSLGQLRRTVDEISRGNPDAVLPVQPGHDFYKLINAINHTATRLAELTREEQRLEQELRRRERLAFLGELAASVAHEINNPLDGVQNCVRILRRSGDNPQRAAQMLELIDSGLARIELIIRRLLTLAREDSVRPTLVNLGDVLQGALRIVAGRFRDGDIRLVRDFAALPDVHFDPLLMEQVFANLLTNAADSISGGGTVTISTRVERHDGRDVVRIDVADSGAGIPDDVLPHIFEPFFTTKGDGRGTGLGLAIAARIVQAHRGSIDVATRSGEGGAVFTVRVPSAPGGERTSAARGAAGPLTVPAASSGS